MKAPILLILNVAAIAMAAPTSAPDLQKRVCTILPPDVSSTALMKVL
jgi:hypothetical protein